MGFYNLAPDDQEGEVKECVRVQFFLWVPQFPWTVELYAMDHPSGRELDFVEKSEEYRSAILYGVRVMDKVRELRRQQRYRLQQRLEGALHRQEESIVLYEILVR